MSGTFALEALTPVAVAAQGYNQGASAETAFFGMMRTADTQRGLQRLIDDVQAARDAHRGEPAAIAALLNFITQTVPEREREARFVLVLQEGVRHALQSLEFFSELLPTPYFVDAITEFLNTRRPDGEPNTYMEKAIRTAQADHPYLASAKNLMSFMEGQRSASQINLWTETRRDHSLQLVVRNFVGKMALGYAQGTATALASAGRRRWKSARDQALAAGLEATVVTHRLWQVAAVETGGFLGTMPTPPAWPYRQTPGIDIEVLRHGLPRIISFMKDPEDRKAAGDNVGARTKARQHLLALARGRETFRIASEAVIVGLLSRSQTAREENLRILNSWTGDSEFLQRPVQLEGEPPTSYSTWMLVHLLKVLYGSRDEDHPVFQAFSALWMNSAPAPGYANERINELIRRILDNARRSGFAEALAAELENQRGDILVAETNDEVSDWIGERIDGMADYLHDTRSIAPARQVAPELDVIEKTDGEVEPKSEVHTKETPQIRTWAHPLQPGQPLEIRLPKGEIIKGIFKTLQPVSDASGESTKVNVQVSVVKRGAEVKFTKPMSLEDWMLYSQLPPGVAELTYFKSEADAASHPAAYVNFYLETLLTEPMTGTWTQQDETTDVFEATSGMPIRIERQGLQLSRISIPDWTSSSPEIRWRDVEVDELTSNRLFGYLPSSPEADAALEEKKAQRAQQFEEQFGVAPEQLERLGRTNIDVSITPVSGERSVVVLRALDGESGNQRVTAYIAVYPDADSQYFVLSSQNAPEWPRVVRRMLKHLQQNQATVLDEPRSTASARNLERFATAWSVMPIRRGRASSPPQLAERILAAASAARLDNPEILITTLIEIGRLDGTQAEEVRASISAAEAALKEKQTEERREAARLDLIDALIALPLSSLPETGRVGIIFDRAKGQQKTPFTRVRDRLQGLYKRLNEDQQPFFRKSDVARYDSEQRWPKDVKDFLMDLQARRLGQIRALAKGTAAAEEAQQREAAQRQEEAAAFEGAFGMPRETFLRYLEKGGIL